MICFKCQSKLSIKNIKRSCKISSDHIVCDKCLLHHTQNQTNHTCPICDSIILYKKNYSNDDINLFIDSLFLISISNQKLNL